MPRLCRAAQINLAWTDNASNESGFRIERSADGATFTEIGVVGPNVTTYANSSLVERCDSVLVPRSRLQRYGVLGLCWPGERDDPVGAHRTGGADEFECHGCVEQLRSTSRGPTTHPTNRVSASSDLRMALRSPRSASSASNVTTYANTSLSAATQYWYRVRAYNATGSSAYAGPASATTMSAPTAPAAPTNLSATAVSSSSDQPHVDRQRIQRIGFPHRAICGWRDVH